MDYGLIVDVETTGIDAETDKIIEIGLLEFGVEAGREPFITNMYGGLQDPGQALDAQIIAITGLDDQILKGQSIDWDIVASFFERSSLYVAHNAAFDRGFIEKLPFSPILEKGHWACSMKHVDWQTHGYKTRALNYLAADHGFVNPFAHRALFDCATTFRLVAPYMDELIQRSYLRNYKFEATGAPFEVKDKLKERRYRWDAQARVWFKEISEDKLDEEREFLSVEIYRGNSRHTETELLD